MRFRVLVAAIAVVVLPLSAAACSDDGPTGTPLSVELQKAGISKGAADCADEAGQKAKLTDKQIKAAVKGNMSGVKAAKAQIYAQQFGDCIGATGANSNTTTTTTP